MRAWPDLLILDCDGVVVDSEPITTRVLADMLGELGVPIDGDTVARRFTGLSFARTLEVIGELLASPLPPDFVVSYRDRTFMAMELELQPVEGVEALLDELGIVYCVASNGPHAKMNKTLGITSMLPRFAGRMFSADDVVRSKPAPDLFLLAARHFGVEPGRCVVVEDSPTGIAAARAAGMHALGYAARTPADVLMAAGANAVFGRMSELPGLIGVVRDPSRRTSSGI
jgi:HAD superfamily hydrolase (TIGR01509 family)